MQKLGIMGDQNKKAKELFWKRRIEKNMNSLRKDLYIDPSSNYSYLLVEG